MSGPRESPLAPATRLLLAVFSILTLLALVVLFGRPEDTGEFFAWTIKAPLTAAFLGAGYGSGCLLVLLSLRAGVWPPIRVPLLTIAVFTGVTLAATLLHLDKFHLHGALSIATAAGWFWLLIYIVIPPAMLVTWWRQERVHRTAEGPAGQAIPVWLAVPLAAEGVVMLAAGVWLFAGAENTGWWPWPLTPLTARAIAAWLIAYGLATLYASRWERLEQSGIQAVAYTGFGVLELLALARFRDSVSWDASGWLYLALLLVVTVTGAAGLWATRAQVAHHAVERV